MTTTTEPFDAEFAEAFAGTLFGLYTGGMLTFMVDLGHRTGLFEAAASGPVTSREPADRAGLQERYVREWLGAMTTGCVVNYDPSTRTNTLPAEHATCLTGGGAANMAPISQFASHLGSHLQQVAHAFRVGGGVPYEEFRPDFTDLYDLAQDAIDKARSEAAEAGVENATFELCDVARLAPDEPFDPIVSFDTIHDKVDPVAVLDCVYRSLVTGGTYPHAGAAYVEQSRGQPRQPGGTADLRGQHVAVPHRQPRPRRRRPGHRLRSRWRGNCSPTPGSATWPFIHRRAILSMLSM